MLAVSLSAVKFVILCLLQQFAIEIHQSEKLICYILVLWTDGLTCKSTLVTWSLEILTKLPWGVY